jgi:SAM-dependent methyltransferase
MKFCLACQNTFVANHHHCPACGHIPVARGGFVAFAPALAEQNDGFNPETFQRYAAVEAEHFWFIARNAILSGYMRRYFPAAKNILEIGCGTGFVLAGTRQVYPDAHLSGSDIFTEGLSYAKQRVPTATLFQMDGCHIPFRNEFDLVGSFDVLEHIEDDQAALVQIYLACQPGSGLIVTVPQHRWLWSSTDEYAHHKRRYTRSELVGKVENAGFRIVYVGSFVSLLLPVMLISRWQQKSAQAQDQMDAGFKIGKLANMLLGMVMKIERGLMACGISFPVGGSLLLLARKP